MDPCRRLCLSASLMLTAMCAHAQDFDADSIYYTPIQKKIAPAAAERRVNIFHDTTTAVKRVAYYFDFGMGTLYGCNDCTEQRQVTFTTSTIHGVTLGRKLRMGIGAGFDTYYGWRTAPLFGNFSFDLAGTKNTHAIFVQLQYGYAFAWRDPRPYEPAPAHAEGGIMSAAYLGYRVRYHDLRIAISTGFKQQAVSMYYESQTWMPSPVGPPVPGTPQRTYVDVGMGRAVIAISFSWR